MNLFSICSALIFLETFMLHLTSVASGKLTVSSRLALAVCEQRDEYSTSNTKTIFPPLKKPSPTSTDPACGWFRIEKCPYCAVKFKSCAEIGQGGGNGIANTKGARTAGKFRSTGSKIDPTLLADLQKRDGSPATATIIINMEGGNDRALKSVRSLSFKTREDRIVSVAESLQALAKNIQEPVLNHIEKTKARLSSLSVSTLWISNQIVVEEADLELVQELAKLPQVSRITPDFVIQYGGNTLENDPESPSENENEGQEREIGLLQHEGWNLKDLEVAAIWKQNITGAGVVIGDIGSGARGTHKGLKDNFRKDHGWYDAVNGSASPFDVFGQGTQNLGVMVTPMNNYGIAPGAKWIACRAFVGDGSFYKEVAKCCEWMLCPRDANGQNQDCKKAPHVINSNFLVNHGQADFKTVISAWRDVGIIPVFGAPNAGDEDKCGSMTVPANYNNVITAGALIMDKKGVIRRAGSTAKGPTKTGGIKPDVIAAGNLAQTIGHESDDQVKFGLDTKNSASAHLVGLIALLLSEKKDLTYPQIYDIVTKSAKQLDKTEGRTCGGTSDTAYPNNLSGYGKINAVTAFKYLREVVKQPPKTTPKP